jgi:hypothetical protein
LRVRPLARVAPDLESRAALTRDAETADSRLLIAQ